MIIIAVDNLSYKLHGDFYAMQGVISYEQIYWQKLGKWNAFSQKAARGFLANIYCWFQIRRFNELKSKPYHVYRVLRLDMGKKKEHLS